MTARARLCATVTATTTADLRRRRDEVAAADLVEVRLDTVRDPDPAGALEGRRRPVVVTCRPAWEGGQFKGSEEERRRILRDALALGAEYVDVEWRAGFGDVVAAAPDRVVLSSHDFEGMPSDLETRARDMRASGAAIVKIAVTPSRLTDMLALRPLGSSPDGAPRTVLIAMGERGLATRVVPERFGSAWTYAGDLAGVGQVTVRTLLDLYRFRDVSGNPRLYGVAGSPVSHSVSPAMHNAAFRALDEDAVYVPLPAADVDDLLAFAGEVDLQGASVTIPFKVPLLERMDDLEDAAREAGAVNTIRRSAGRWSGTNTDVAGFLQPLDSHGVALDGLRVSVLGAGGSARAVVVALASRGARITVHARQAQAAAAVAALGGGTAGPWPPASGSWDLLVNCTPVGMYPRVDESPMAVAALGGCVVYDLIYNPPETHLLRDARQTGCASIGGLDMLVAQAEAQCRWWTGRTPPQRIMRTAALNRLSELSNEHHVV